jgi:hypothetical protein
MNRGEFEQDVAAQWPRAHISDRLRESVVRRAALLIGADGVIDAYLVWYKAEADNSHEIQIEIATDRAVCVAYTTARPSGLTGSGYRVPFDAVKVIKMETEGESAAFADQPATVAHDVEGLTELSVAPALSEDRHQPLCGDREAMLRALLARASEHSIAILTS